MNDRNPIVATDGRYDYRVLDLVGPEPGGERYLGEAISRAGIEPVSIRTFNDRNLVDERFRDRLLEAVKLHRIVQHTAIHPIRSFIELHHAPAIISDALHGRLLGDLLGDGSMPVRAAAAMGEQIASGLHALHTAGIGGIRPLGRTHQDLHPDTILITHSGESRMLEVGTARARIALDRPDVSGQPPLPAYAAPERRDGKDRAQSDVYSLAVVLLQALSGLHPDPLPDDADGHARTAAKMVAAIPTVPTAIRGLLLEMLSFSPDDRPSAREVGRRLRAQVPDLSGPWLSAWAGERIDPPAPIRPLPTPVFAEVEDDPADDPTQQHQQKGSRIEALRPLRKTADDELADTRRHPALVALVSIGLALVVTAGAVMLLDPPWITRWWVDSHGTTDLEDVDTELAGPPDEPTGGTKVVQVHADELGDTVAASAEGSGAGVIVVGVEGTPPSIEPVLAPAPPVLAPPPTATAPDPTPIVVQIIPSTPAPDPHLALAAIIASTNPDAAQTKPRITRRRLQKRIRPVQAEPAFGENFEDAPNRAKRVAVEVFAPLALELTVVCADGIRGTHSEEVRLSDVPVGRCDVQAVLGNATAQGTFQLEASRRVECRLEFADNLRCW